MPLVDLSERYEIQDVLGKGGMGEVLRALDTRLDRPVAIKRILGEMARSQKALSRFLTEAKSIAALNHFNIVQIYDYGRDTKGPFIIMELVEGESLQEKLKAGKLEFKEAIDLTCQLCDALGKAHGAGIIHRDIKPANILLTEDGEPKLTDFGLARQDNVDHGQTQAGTVLGTIDFMPPEQRRDATATDGRSDLWSLAATLYQMITGKSPKIIKFNDVPQALQDVLGKALEDAPGDRYQTAAELGAALQATLQDSGSATADLGEGECPECGITNESSRMFCRNCATSLGVPCLSCADEMPMWEEVCDSCGTKQNDLAETRKAEMAAQQEQAGELLKIYDFAAAGKIATALQDEPDLRFRHLKGWAEQFLGDVEQEREQQQQRMLELLKEALQHEQAYDYRAGIHTLEQVSDIQRQEPLPDHPSGVAEVLSRLIEKQTESQRLDQLIRERIKSRQLAGLLDEVDSLLQLRPDHVEMGTLRDKLVDRNEKLQATRDSALPTAQQLFSNKDYEGCLAELGKIDASVMTSEAEELRGHCTETLDHLEQLKSSIGEAVKQKKLQGLLKQVEEYLGLKPDAAEMKKLQQQLTERDKQNAVQIAEMVQTAQRLRGECRFSDAVDTLRRIPQQLQTPEMISLLNDCDSLATTRVTAMDALQSAIQGEQYQSGLTGADLYRETLKSQSLNDQAFADQYQSCAVTLQQQQDVAQAANQRRAKIKKMIIAGSALAAVLLLMVAGLWFMWAASSSAKREADRVAAERLAAVKNLAAEKTITETVVTLTGHTSYVASVAFSPDGRRIVSGSGDSTVKVWDAETGQETLTLTGHSWRVMSVSFSPDGKQIVSGGGDFGKPGEIKVWDADSGQEVLALKGHTTTVNSVVFSPDGKRIVSGSYGNYNDTLKVWDAETGQELLALKGHTGPVKSVSFSPDGKRIVSGSFDDTAKIWDAETGQLLQTITGAGDRVSIALSPDGRRIVSGRFGQKTLKVWDAETGHEVLTLKGHSGTVSSVSFSPDGKRIMSGSHDKTLKVWDAETGQEMLTLEGHSDSVESVSFSPDGKRIVSGSHDKTVKIWDISPLEEDLQK
jgi:WD40 repeat protein/predicted Ser/Thr protein kinase